MPVASESVTHGGADGNDGRLADRLRTEGTITVVGVGEEDLGSGDVGEGRNAVIPEGGIHDGAGRVDHHPLEEGRPDPLGDSALELSPRLHGVDDLCRRR